MNNLLNKLERKFGRYAVPDLIKYVIVLYCVGAMIGIINPDIYYSWTDMETFHIPYGTLWIFKRTWLYSRTALLYDSGKSVFYVWKNA